MTAVLFLGGRSGVGKTSLALEIHAQLSAADVRHCLIEGDNLDQAWPVPWQQGHELAEQNLAAMWANYRALGYQKLIYTNTASVRPEVIDSLVTAMGDNPEVTAVLLMASDETARQRLAVREIGTTYDLHVTRSDRAAAELSALAPAWVHRVVTDNRPVAELAAEVIALTGWSLT